MKLRSHEKGQALILIAFAAIGLFAFASLAIDGSMLLSDKRHAQNAADTAALAAALAHARGEDMNTAATDRATSNGYEDNGTTKDVTVTIADAPSGVCPANVEGKEITVTIVSTINTTFARVIGRNQLTNTVTATSRACGTYTGPPFDGNAIVALAPAGKGYDGTGTPNWIIEGGGIFSNSSDNNAAYCNGAAEITAPSVTVVGGVDFNCHGVNITEPINEDADQYTSYSSYSALFPREPACNGTAYQSGGQWHPEAGMDGSTIAFSGDMDFASGLYCVTNSPGPYHGALTGTNVTFYIMSANFSMTFNGAGNHFNATAPTSGEYDGVLIYMAPQVDANGNLLNTQQLDLRGNGDADIVGSIIAPSADVTMFGNSNSDALINSQIIAYHVDSGGNADIHIQFQQDDNFQATLPISLTMLK
ncbi:MAG TPA: pilus assembly protein TadG-related protein [Anaerolineales bacterium]|nr:pilus assembly protein TadG-related protein [Anaerolineales bacterium]